MSTFKMGQRIFAPTSLFLSLKTLCLRLVYQINFYTCGLRDEVYLERPRSIGTCYFFPTLQPCPFKRYGSAFRVPVLEKKSEIEHIIKHHDICVLASSFSIKGWKKMMSWGK